MRYYSKLKYVFVLSLLCIFISSHGKYASAATVIQDDADTLTDSEESTLASKCNDMLDKYDTSIYIWTDPDISKSDSYDYEMEQFVASQNDSNVVILLIGMAQGDRVYEIQGYGTAQTMMNNTRCNHVMDDMYDDLHDGDYYGSITTFCDKTASYLGKDPKFDSIAFSPLAQFLVSLLIGVAVIATMAYNSGGRVTTDDHTYLDIHNSAVIGSFDRYTHTTTTRVPKPKDNGGGNGGGGGGGHSNGGGRSF